MYPRSGDKYSFPATRQRHLYPIYEDQMERRLNIADILPAARFPQIPAAISWIFLLPPMPS